MLVLVPDEERGVPTWGTKLTYPLGTQAVLPVGMTADPPVGLCDLPIDDRLAMGVATWI